MGKRCELVKKTVVITGCSAGVGRAAALLFDRAGWQVFAVVRKKSDAASLIAEAQGPLTAFLADVGNRDQVLSVAAQVAELCPNGLNGLICNAGVGGAGPLEFAPLDELAKAIDTNIYGGIFCAQGFLPLLRKAHGRIINITSGSTLLPFPGVSTYPASKYALELLSRQLRAEVKQFGVDVIVVDPGRVKSRMTQTAEAQNKTFRAKLAPEAFELYGDLLDKLDKMSTAMIGSGKDPEEVARIYLKALSDPQPKEFYSVGRDTKVLRLIGRWSPQWLLAKMVDRILSRVGGQASAVDASH
jgi:NAD(P)-dependent dehydrogenase (short-subunit alcohol dehydrogenase family)